MKRQDVTEAYPLAGSYNVGSAVVAWTVEETSVLLKLLLTVENVAEQMLTPLNPNWSPTGVQVGNDSILSASFTAIFPGGDQLGSVAINAMQVGTPSGTVNVQNIHVCAWTRGGEPIYNYQQ